MSEAHRPIPPLSPVRLAGMAMRPLPVALLRPALEIALAVMHRRHGAVFDRMKSVGAPTLLIDPVDLPLVFLLDLDPDAPGLRAFDDAPAVAASATIRAPFLRLVDLLEGRIDGDALFFSRELVIEGDTEVVLALRNAVDGEEIDLIADAASLAGPLAGPADRLARGAAALAARAAADLDALRAAVAGPVRR